MGKPPPHVYVVDVAESRPRRWADLKVFKRSGLVGKLIRAGVEALGNLGYVGIDGVSPRWRGTTPRRKPRGQDRSPQDRRYNRAFARRRIRVEHGINQLRRYQVLSQVDRHHRRQHTARVQAVTGLVNRMLDHQQDA
ncbi:MAG TPA: transposase family protein [Gemmataceae bacterium]|nr:transposase family protein [Gemmataceae bacterium]